MLPLKSLLVGLALGASASAQATTTSAPWPTQTGIPDNCSRYHHAVLGDLCYEVAAKYGITLDDFYKWNPAVGRDCSSFFGGWYYCVAVGSETTTKIPTTTTTTQVPSTTLKPTSKPTVIVPSPTQPPQPDNCNKWHLVETGQHCAAVVAKNGITLADFYKWNPSVGKNCENLWLGYYVCVGTA